MKISLKNKKKMIENCFCRFKINNISYYERKSAFYELLFIIIIIFTGFVFVLLYFEKNPEFMIIEAIDSFADDDLKY